MKRIYNIIIAVIFITTACKTSPKTEQNEADSSVIMAGTDSSDTATDSSEIALNGDEPEAESSENVEQTSIAVEVTAPETVIRNYYDAINSKRYEVAYQIWDNKGEASGKTFEVFKNGFADTESVKAEIGEPTNGDAAMGREYIEVPVSIYAITKAQVAQTFNGTYTLSRAFRVEAEDKQWHIMKARMVKMK